MKKYLFTILSICICSLAMAQPPTGDAKAGDVYGDGTTIKNDVIKTDLTQSLLGDQPIDGNFEGTVTEVCSKKGCWLKLKLSDGKVATVKMKDYGFFVPTALEGKNILINGNAALKTTSVKELQHLAEDGGKSKEEVDAITEPKETITIMANGIKVKG